MADVRNLLQREREARRIQHPHLSYSKSGALTCSICNLNVKSEALWEGHLKSANHRKNLREAAANTIGGGNGKKRKIEEIAEEDNPRKRKTADEEFEGEGRKKRQVSFQSPDLEDSSAEGRQLPAQAEGDVLPGFVRPEAPLPQVTPSPPPAAAPDPSQQVPAVDEEEWAAFEAEVAPLAREQPQDYSGAVISAAPLSASELAAQQAAEERRGRKDLEAEDEKEEEQQKMAEEFDVMEEMEERVRRLKEKREALRTARANASVVPEEEAPHEEAQERPPEQPESDSDDGEDVDDWYP